MSQTVPTSDEPTRLALKDDRPSSRASESLVEGPAPVVHRIPAIPLVPQLPRFRKRIPEIAGWEPKLEALQDYQLRKQSLSLRYRARSGESLDRLLGEAFALVREAARRSLNMRHFDVQMLGGIAMYHGCIAEMETGEGKTLTATLPMYLRALVGKGAHLATVNDYLAKRDADLMAPVYRMLGMSIGAIQTEMNQEQRRVAYGCDITYGTAKEFGFDFLRDRLLIRRLGESSADGAPSVNAFAGAGGRVGTARAARDALLPGRRSRQHPDR